MLKTPSRLPDAALVLVAAMWGGSYLAAKTLTAAAPAPVVLALRFLPSALLLLGLVVLTRSAITRQVVWIGLVLGAVQAVTLLLETESVARTSAVNAGVIVSLALVIAPVCEGLLSKDWLPGSYYTAASIAIVGVLLLVGPQGLTKPNLGDLLILLAAFTRSALMVASARLTKGKQLSTVSLSAVQAVLNAVVFAGLAGPRLGAVSGRLDSRQWAVVAFLSVGCTLLAFVLQLWAIQRTSATRASLLMGTEPVWAVLAGVLIGGEHATAVTLAGAAIIVAATMWGQQIELRWRAAAELRRSTGQGGPAGAALAATPGALARPELS